MGSDYQIFWSDEAIDNLASILDYISTSWTEREISKFKIRLDKQLNLIKSNPYIFPKSQFLPRLRKAVLSKQTVVFYEVADKSINLVYLFNTKQDIRKMK